MRCTGAQFTTIFPGPVLNIVRAYIHCNHLQSAPTTRDSAPASIATLTGAVNPPWRVTSLARPFMPSLDAIDYLYLLPLSKCEGVTASTPPSTQHPAFVRLCGEGCAHIIKYPVQSLFSGYPLLSLASLLFALSDCLINNHPALYCSLHRIV
jgi:hypothetical protein